MSSEGTHGFRQEKTPENIHRMIAKKNKEEDETIKVLRAQLSQDNSKDLIAQSNQISKDILNQILTSNNSSKVNITFDDRGPLVQKKLPTSPLNQGVLSSNHNF